jgi:hypothetical protein
VHQEVTRARRIAGLVERLLGQLEATGVVLQLLARADQRDLRGGPPGPLGRRRGDAATSSASASAVCSLGDARREQPRVGAITAGQRLPVSGKRVELGERSHRRTGSTDNRDRPRRTSARPTAGTRDRGALTGDRCQRDERLRPVGLE